MHFLTTSEGSGSEGSFSSGVMGAEGMGLTRRWDDGNWGVPRPELGPPSAGHRDLVGIDCTRGPPAED
jgi:hypothetical protein